VNGLASEIAHGLQGQLARLFARNLAAGLAPNFAGVFATSLTCAFAGSRTTGPLRKRYVQRNAVGLFVTTIARQMPQSFNTTNAVNVVGSVDGDAIKHLCFKQEQRCHDGSPFMNSLPLVKPELRHPLRSIAVLVTPQVNFSFAQSKRIDCTSIFNPKRYIFAIFAQRIAHAGICLFQFIPRYLQAVEQNLAIIGR